MDLLLWKQSNVFLRFSLVISYFATLAGAQDLAFLSPDLTPVVSGGALPHYTVGDYVGVSWTTPFEETNLLVYQLKETAYAYEVLALNYNTSTTFFVWYAQAVDGEPLNTDHPFHFVLENGKSYSCEGCVTQSPFFNVRRQQPQADTTSSSTPKSTSGAGGATTSQPTQAHQTQQSQTQQAQTQHSQTQKHTAAPSAAGATGQDRATPSPSSSKSNHDLGIGLGVGLGVGIPLLLAVAGLCFLLARKRRKEKRRVSYHPTGSGNWTAEPKSRPESGALGPSAMEERRQSGLSQASRQSYLDPFDFEKAETRDQDALSQLRRSIHSSGSDYSQKMVDVDAETPSSAKASTTRETSWPLHSNNGNDLNTKYAWMGGPTGATKAGSGWGAGAAAARRSDLSHANTDLSSLEGMPEQLQPVHHRYSPEYGSPLAKTEYAGGYGNGTNNAAYASHGDGRDWPLP